jgi:hypothetical protein
MLRSTTVSRHFVEEENIPQHIKKFVLSVRARSLLNRERRQILVHSNRKRDQAWPLVASSRVLPARHIIITFTRGSYLIETDKGQRKHNGEENYKI